MIFQKFDVKACRGIPRMKKFWISSSCGFPKTIIFCHSSSFGFLSDEVHVTCQSSPYLVVQNMVISSAIFLIISVYSIMSSLFIAFLSTISNWWPAYILQPTREPFSPSISTRENQQICTNTTCFKLILVVSASPWTNCFVVKFYKI
jgi:hypothetical protein